MLKKSILLLLLIFTSLPAQAEWQMDELMIFGGWPWVKGADPDAQAKIYADAGFNILMGERDKLDICQKYGLKLIVTKITPNDVPAIKDHPALWGYWIIDEPLRNFPAVRALKKAYQNADPDHPAYVNLVSRSGEYLSSYMDIVGPELLSYDYYQWWWGMDGHFPKLEIHRDAALKANVPLACWFETNSAFGFPYEDYDKSRPEDNEARLRMSVYTCLAYGVTGIEWFTGRALFEKDGSALNDAGRDVAKINAELKRLGPILMGLKSVDVFHLPPLPSGTRATPEKHWVKILQSGYPNLVMGEFQDKDDVDYLLMANTNWTNDKLAVLQFVEPVLKVEKFDKTSGNWHSLPIGKNGVTKENERLVTRNINHLMYSQSTGGHLIEHFQHLRDNWLSDRTGSQFVEFMLAPGDGDLLRITRDFAPETTRN